MPVLPPIAWLLMALSSASLTFWIIIWWRVCRTVRETPTIRRGLELSEPAPGWPKVSVIVPVHNGERVIDACVESLRGQQYDNLQIIFVLDRCTDRTLPILRRHAEADDRITLLEIDACPPDWAGKCHAARLGAGKATGEWLLFADADTQFDPWLVRASLALAMDRSLGMLSLLSTLTYQRAFERIIQPVAIMNLIRMYPIERVNRPEPGRIRPFANGQFMLFDRKWYEQIGGHEAVKDDLLEDIALARRLSDAGGQGGLFAADGMLTCSMYDSPEALKTGWKRIFIEACKRKPRRLRSNAWKNAGIGLAAPSVQLLALVVGFLLLWRELPLPWLGLALIGLAVIGSGIHLMSLLRIYDLCGAPRTAAVYYPIGCWSIGSVMFAAARDLKKRRPVIWADREYVLEPRY
ncbi:MAG: glycosyltransferase [Phycisphaerales bacterium]|nr:MAG: glycosyltransferase [Phycisphaerales bacterium]